MSGYRLKAKKGHKYYISPPGWIVGWKFLWIVQRIFTPNLIIDLTRLFGNGREPKTKAEVERIFPNTCTEYKGE